MKSLYVSKDAFKKGEGILIADDIIDSGETQRAMIKVAYKAKAEVIGIYALVAIGDTWKQRIESVRNIPVEIGTQPIKKEINAIDAEPRPLQAEKIQKPPST